MEQSKEIKKLEKRDLGSFFRFIENHWKQDHIFCRDLNIFEFQHKEDNGDYNFLISKPNNCEIEAILGYIFSNRKKDSLWLAIWKSKDNSGEGFRLLKQLSSPINLKFIGAIGISEDAQKLYEVLGWKLGATKHYYLNLTYPNLRRNRLGSSKFGYKFIDKLIDINSNPNCYPIKDEFYYNKRFLNHPSFNYIPVFLENLKLLFIGRYINYLGFRVFRIVDVIGNMDGVKFKNPMLQFMSDEKIDLIEMNMFDSENPDIDMFLKKEGEVIPLYLNPFVNDNIEVKLGYKSKIKHVRFFLGDSDQDRPN